MFDETRTALANTGLRLGREELLDALWLAHKLPPGADAPLARRLAALRSVEPAAPSGSAADPQDHDMQPLQAAPGQQAPATASKTTSPEPVAPGSNLTRPSHRSSAVWLPDTRALRDGAAIGRSLRPIKRRVPGAASLDLDEIATADIQADTGTDLLVLRPRTERWMRLVLVIDGGVPMLLWERHCAELATVFERSGAFRQIEMHQIRFGPELLVGRPWTAAPATRSARSLTDPSGRTMILLLSDGASSAWRDGRMRSLLKQWAASGPTAIIHTLPVSMWAGSAIDGDVWRVSSPRAGAPNTAWKVAHPVLPREIARFDGVPIPIVPLTAPGMSTWTAVMTKSSRPTTARLWEPPGPANTDREVSASVFGKTASPAAVRLAAHLSAVAPLTVPVMQLVASCTPGGSDPVRLAEVFLSGVLRPVLAVPGQQVNPHHRLFDFAPEVKDALLDAFPTDELVDSSLRVGEHLERLVGRSRLFPAWLVDHHDDQSAPTPGSANPHPFARVSPVFLKRFGLQEEHPVAARDWPSRDDLRSTLQALIDEQPQGAHSVNPEMRSTQGPFGMGYDGNPLPPWSVVEGIAAASARARQRVLTADFLRLLREQYVQAALVHGPEEISAVLTSQRQLLRQRMGSGYTQGRHGTDVEFLLLHLLGIVNDRLRSRMSTSQAGRLQDASPQEVPLTSAARLALEFARSLRAAGLKVSQEPETYGGVGRHDMAWSMADSFIPIEVKAAGGAHSNSSAAFSPFDRLRVGSKETTPVSFLIIADDSQTSTERATLAECTEFYTDGTFSIRRAVIVLLVPSRSGVSGAPASLESDAGVVKEIEEPEHASAVTTIDDTAGSSTHEVHVLPPSLPVPATSYAVLIGAGRSAHLPPLASVYEDVHELASFLGSSGEWRLPSNHVTVLLDLADNERIVDVLRASASAAVDTLFIYFAGHASVSARGETHLIFTDSDAEDSQVSVLSSSRVAQIISGSKARRAVLILDACVSGVISRVFPRLSLEPSASGPRNTFMAIAASSGDRTTDPRQRFTQVLLGVASDGNPDGTEFIGFEEAFSRVRQRIGAALGSRNFTAEARSFGLGTPLALCSNPAFVAPRAPRATWAMPVLLPAAHPSAAALMQQVAAQPLLRGAEPAEPWLAAVRLDDAGQFIVEDRTGPLHPPHPADETGTAHVLRDLSVLARAAALRELIYNQERTLGARVALAWGLVQDGARRPLPRTDATTLKVGQRVYISVRNEGDETVYISLLDIGASGRISVLTSFSDSGVGLAPGREYLLGFDDYRGILTGVPLTWPDGLESAHSREETLLLLVTSQPQDVRVLEQDGISHARSRPAVLSDVQDQISTGRTHERAAVSSLAERCDVHRLDFELDPTPVDGNSLVEEHPNLPTLANSGRTQAPATNLRLVFVHGIGTWRDAAQAARNWTNALARGARRAGNSDFAAELDRGGQIDIVFAYYGDLFDDRSSQAAGGDPSGQEQAEILQELLVELIDGYLAETPAAQETIQLLRARDQLLDNGAVRRPRSASRQALDAATALMSFGPLNRAGRWASGRLLVQELTQVARYLARAEPDGDGHCLDERIRSRMHEAIGAGPAVVVAHSLGSVVALEALHETGNQLAAPVPLLVTIGSPLGLPTAVWPRLRPRPPRTPDRVDRWLNFWDRDDLLVARPRLAVSFEPNVRGVLAATERIDSDGLWMHTAMTYLDKPGVAGPIAEAFGRTDWTG